MEPNLTSPFTAQEFSDDIAALKNGKAIGLDGIFTEELKHFGQRFNNTRIFGSISILNFFLKLRRRIIIVRIIKSDCN